MYILFKNPVFLFFIFILFFIMTNVFIVSILDNISVTSGFFTVYSFWLLIIVILFITSRALIKIDKDEGEDV